MIVSKQPTTKVFVSPEVRASGLADQLIRTLSADKSQDRFVITFAEEKTTQTPLSKCVSVAKDGLIGLGLGAAGGAALGCLGPTGAGIMIGAGLGSMSGDSAVFVVPVVAGFGGIFGCIEGVAAAHGYIGGGFGFHQVSLATEAAVGAIVGGIGGLVGFVRGSVRPG